MTLFEAITKNYDDTLVRTVYEAIAQAVAPWNPGRIRIWQDDWLGHHPSETLLGCDVEIFPEIKFLASADRLKDPNAIAASFADEAFKFYRNRPALPVEDHIILGEE